MRASFLLPPLLTLIACSSGPNEPGRRAGLGGWYSTGGVGAAGILAASGGASSDPSSSGSSGAAFDASVALGGAFATGGGSQISATDAGDPAVFHGSLLLGSPSTNSIRLSVLSPDQSGSVAISYGTSPDSYGQETEALSVVPGKPVEIGLDALLADTRYYYRLSFQAAGLSSTTTSDEHFFHTARPRGSTFAFTVQADSHLDANSDYAVYERTLENVLAEEPDFHVDLGDTFMCEKNSTPLSTVSVRAPDTATVNARYEYERANFGIVTHSVPLFLVNGNHDGELGWLNNGTSENLAVWTTEARQQFYLNPAPDVFYSGDSTDEPFVGKRASWYSWEWGDALFIALDPFWNSKIKSSTDGWATTLGPVQYQWLSTTLGSSASKYKFVFIHNLVGGLDGNMRGGVEAAPYYEWGGENADGSIAFEQMRPGWGKPIHQLLVDNGVTAVFHGHDHLYAKQELDGIIYQEVPQPSARNSSNGPNLATSYHYTSGTILSSSGHLRVTVTPDRVTGEYVRTWLSSQETQQRHNRDVDDQWTIPTK